MIHSFGKLLIITSLAAGVSSGARGQALTLTLERTIALAADSSLEAFRSKNVYMSSYIPFMVGTGGREGFWFPLAAGTIGGLIMSLIGIFIFLPLFLLKRKQIIK